MPRPGPRPYECVRRAWHSERHQPIRGSLIQEIFRVVIEIHSSATKRNKEWQEKLPIVVLKAEEIMYSKANSEAEYMDLETLWDRANGAINTIIRRDDSAETGDLLQPCVEAALHLGCVPRRASRSQRDNDPRCYLSPNPQEPMSSCLKNSITSPHCMAMYSDIFNLATLSPQLDAAPDNIPFKNFPLHFPPQTSSIQPMAQTCTASVEGHSVYPLYYWSCNQGNDRGNSLSKKTGTNDMDATNKPEAARFSEMPQTAPPISCDLSLRLGPCRGSKDIEKQSHREEFRNTEELHLFPEEDAAKILNMDKPGKKRRALPLKLCSSQPNKLHRNPDAQLMKFPGS